MRKSLLILLFILPILAAPAADKPKHEPLKVRAINGVLPTPGISRTQVVSGDPLRGRLVSWDRQRRLPDTSVKWTLTDLAPPGKVTPLVRLDGLNYGRSGDWWDQFYHGEVLIPDGLKAGQYKLTAGPVTWPLEVVDPPKRKARWTYGPGTALKVVQDKLNDGNEVLLQAGLYEWSKPLVLPENCTLTGPGAIIRYSGPQTVDEYAQDKVSMLITGSWATIDGITFECPRGGYLFDMQHGANNLTMVNCNIVNSIIALMGDNYHFEDCHLKNSRIWNAGHGGLMRRLLFTGQTNEPFSIWGADHNLAMIDCSYMGTGRGITCNAGSNDIRGNLILGMNVDAVNWLTNANELLLCEPASAYSAKGFHDNLIIHYRVNCGPGGGSAVQWDGRASGNLVLEAKINGCGLSLGGDNVDNNDFDTIEVRNGFFVVLSKGCTNNRFVNSAVINPQPSSWNQHWIIKEWYTGWRCSPITWDTTGPGPGTGNSFVNMFARLDPQYTFIPAPNTNIYWNNVTVNDKAYP